MNWHFALILWQPFDHNKGIPLPREHEIYPLTCKADQAKPQLTGNIGCGLKQTSSWIAVLIA